MNAVETLRQEFQERLAGIEASLSGLKTLHAAIALLEAAPENVTVKTVRRYKKRNGNGHVAATAKTNGHVKRVQDKASKATRRERTARFLEGFDRRTPIAAEAVANALGVTMRELGVGVLVRHDYLKRKGSGLVRTAKAFHA